MERVSERACVGEEVKGGLGEGEARPSDTTGKTLAFSHCRALSRRVLAGLCFKRITGGEQTAG